jgi:DNA-directed RNA polymerase specialized sigma24 family protein
LAERKELDQALQHCLDELPSEFRAVVVLVDVQGWITAKQEQPWEAGG